MGFNLSGTINAPVAPAAAALIVGKGMAIDYPNDSVIIRANPYFSGDVASLGAMPIATSRWEFSLTQGSVFIEADPVADDSVALSKFLFTISNGSGVERIYVRNGIANERRLNIGFFHLSANQASVTTGINTAAAHFKIALGWSNTGSGDFVAFLNGVQVLNDAAGTVPTDLTDLDIGTDQVGSGAWTSDIDKFLVRPERPLNGELQAWSAP